MRDILSLDESAMTVHLEPLVDVGTITRWLVPRGYMLACTLEIEEATIGGLACAVGMTTASHKYGLLQETVEEFEIVLGSGKLVKAHREGEHADLFHAFPWSHGSLGLLVGLTLKVIPIKKYVRVDYTPVSGGMDRYCAKIREVSLKDEPADFVEVTCYSRTQAVIMEGTFSDTATYEDASGKTVRGKINNLNLWYKPWFYKYVEAKLKGGEASVEFTPTQEYIFRHNRATFWTLRDQLPERIGNHWLFRLCLGWMTPIMVTFLKLPATPAIREEMMTKRVYQDITLPLRTLEEAITKAGALFEIWPILVYPSRIYDHGAEGGQFPQPLKKDMVKGTSYAMYYDLGVYGIPQQIKDGKPFSTVKSMREMEEFTSENQGTELVLTVLVFPTEPVHTDVSY
jgi:delta24-sterol reductase